MTQRTGARYLADTFEANGIGAFFLVPTILSRTLYEMERHTAIKRIITHGEKAAAYMADGYARVSGGIGLVGAQTIGAANLAAGLRDPYLACSPVLAISGGPFPWSRHRSQYQEIEDFPLFKPVTKFSAHVPDVNRFPDLLARAMRAAVSGKPGPVHLEMPGHEAQILETEMLDADIPLGLNVLPRFRPHPEPEAVSRAIDAILAAKRPVIVSGGGVRTSGAQAELVALAERLELPIATSLNGKDTVPATHRLSIGIPGLYPRQSANEIIMEADLVIYVGSQTSSQLTLNWQIPPKSTPTVHIDIEPEELGRHYLDALPVVGDAKTTLGAMLALVAQRGTPVNRSAWLARVATITEAWHSWADPRMASDAVPMRPERIVRELTGTLPDDAILVVDTGHSGMWSGGYLDLNHAGQRYLRAGGSLGWGLPASLGAKLAAPDRPVVLFSGDGGFWYHVGELETAARWNISTVMVVNNNQALNQEINPYTVAYGGELTGRHGEIWHFNDVDFSTVAESMGVKGIRVTDPADVAPAIERALEMGGPVVVDIVSDRNIVAPKGLPRKGD